MTSKRQMHLGAVPYGTGGPGSHTLWLDPEIPGDASVDVTWYAEMARLAERAKFDLVFVVDSQFITPHSPPHYLNRLEPLTLLSALATHTERIGLVGTATTSFNSPFNLVRRLGSLDLISGGRAGWNVVTSGDAGTAGNYGLDDHYDYETRYGRAQEYVELARALWDSYEDDAFVRDRETGVFLDPSKQHVLDHDGTYFKVRGPLNLVRSAQGHPVIFQAGDSDQGRDLGASVGEGIFTHASDIADGQAFYNDLKDRARTRFGRNPDHLLIMPSTRIVVGDTDAEAREIEAHNNEHDHTFEAALAEFGRPFGWHDFHAYDLDAPFPTEALKHGERSFYTRAREITQRAVENRWTLRETVESTRQFHQGEFVGSPETVAAKLIQWWDARACDGFNVGIDHPANFRRIVNEVVPILQERGVFRSEYDSTTLRGHLGLPIPANRHTADREAVGEAVELSLRQGRVPVPTSVSSESTKGSRAMATSARTTSPPAHLSRRGFLGLSLGAGLLLAVEACGGSSTGAGTSGGTIKWAWQLPTTWDPVTSSAGSDVQMLALVYDPITALDKQGNAVPWLAESWEYDKSGTKLTFKLRPGLKFSDGTPLDAEAVAKSIERGRTQKGSLIAPQMKSLERVLASGARDVVLELSEVDYQYPLLLAGKTGMVVNPAVFEDDVESLATQPAGSGPFTVTAYTQNDHATMEKNGSFFAADEIKVSAFDLYPQADPATVVASVQSGQYNVARLLGAQVQQAKDAGLDVQVIDTMYVNCLDVHAGMEPFNDPAVVEALKYGIDREKIKKVANFGIGDVNYQPFPPGYVGYNPDLADIYAYNPEKARKLLSDAGYTKPVPAVLTNSGLADAVVEQIQSQLNEVGFDATIETIPQTQHTQVVYIEHSRALTYDGFAGRESPVQAFQVLFGADGLMNPARKDNPKLEAQLKKVKETPTDAADYPELLQEATKIAVTSFPNTFLYLAPAIVARNKVSELPGLPSLLRFEGVTAS